MTRKNRSTGQPGESGPQTTPSLKQLVHWATGDREAEAEELAKSSRSEVSVDDAVVAVKRAHGDVPSELRADVSQIASAEDAESVHEERLDHESA